ncbi:hypothetical protein B296_00031955 [Ensete ventricosum]|uniref:Uncharacterized protein n=1 Tax=Ensete ventricosum TaxID=4639 RepID=A0A426Y0M4_ENSVE|nr:hypothetical protein B296_00031955 [Ensete ventricosum]
MRLNHVESLYALLLHFRSKGSKERGWSATASPQGRPATVAHRGDACGQKRCPQGLSLAASRGSARLQLVRRGATPVEVPPAGAEPAVGATAPWQGNDAKGAKGLGHSF